MDSWKKLYANIKDKSEVIEEFWKTYDPNGWSIWELKYIKAEGEGDVLYKTNNLLKGFV